MSDREKVLELVESIIVHAEDERTNRSWESDDIGWKNIDKIWGCSQQLKELLKEQEVKEAHWIEYPECLKYDGAFSNDQIVCSACKHVFSIIDNCTEEFDYCPHCGARMEGR